jgi:hypothetical protein
LGLHPRQHERLALFTFGGINKDLMAMINAGDQSDIECRSHHCSRFMASNRAANTAPNRVPEQRVDFFEKKKASCLLLLRLVPLAKLSKSEVDFASNHGTMPRPAVESSSW